MTQLLHKDLTYYLRGLGFRIHKALGGGHPEKHYETAVIAGLEADHVPFLNQHTYWITYRNQQIGQYRPDFTLANGAVQLDLKAMPLITALHKAQLLSYLAVTNAELGFIMNFGARSMQYDRLPNFLSSRERSPIQRPLDPNLLYFALTKQVLDALYTVHFAIGPGFWHKVYRRATRIELAQMGVPFVFLNELPLTYAGQVIAMRPTRLMLVDQKLLEPQWRSTASPRPIRRNCAGRNRSRGVTWRFWPISRRRSWMCGFCGSSRGNTQGQWIQDRNGFCSGWTSGSGVGKKCFVGRTPFASCTRPPICCCHESVPYGHHPHTSWIA